MDLRKIVTSTKSLNEEPAAAKIFEILSRPLLVNNK